MTTPTLQPVYASSATLACSLETVPLASSATVVAGQESASFSNASSLYAEIRVAGKVTVGTTPTSGTYIMIFAFESLDDTPTWPDVFDGTDSAETLTSVGVGAGFLKPAATMYVDSTTSNRSYPFDFYISPLFGLMVPKNWGLFVTHNTGVALNSTGSNHVFKTTGYNWAFPSV
jgi:hypothetical protein